jgi:hypothetical protein
MYWWVLPLLKRMRLLLLFLSWVGGTEMDFASWFGSGDGGWASAWEELRRHGVELPPTHPEEAGAFGAQVAAPPQPHAEEAGPHPIPPFEPYPYDNDYEVGGIVSGP